MLKYVLTPILLMALGGCALAPSDEKLAEHRLKIKQCEARGGHPVRNIWNSQLLAKCMTRLEYNAKIKERQECEKEGGRVNVDIYGFIQSCSYPVVSAPLPPDTFYKPVCPPSKYPIYGCPAPGSTVNTYVTDYDWDWDYQPANGQWVCRGIQTGQYAALSNCAYDIKDDNRWPG